MDQQNIRTNAHLDRGNLTTPSKSPLVLIHRKLLVLAFFNATVSMQQIAALIAH